MGSSRGWDGSYMYVVTIHVWMGHERMYDSTMGSSMGSFKRHSSGAAASFIVLDRTKPTVQKRHGIAVCLLRSHQSSQCTKMACTNLAPLPPDRSSHYNDPSTNAPPFSEPPSSKCTADSVSKVCLRLLYNSVREIRSDVLVSFSINGLLEIHI